MRLMTALLLLVGAPALGAPALEIVRDGAPVAAIVVAPDASGQVRGAARLLASYVEQSTGARLPVGAEPPDEGVVIYVGGGPHVERFGLDQADLDADGFDIAFMGERAICIAGPGDWGTEFGVYEFLERYVGVRWLMPGEHGTDVPSHATLTVPAEPIRGEPVFFSRQLSGLRGGVQAEWARRNRMHGRVSFHHNLRELFPWETYTESHPEFYPVRGGERILPTHREGWQPCFSAPGIVEEAIKNITAYFDENPARTSYSLGINDNRNFCQCDDCLAAISGEDNFLGYVDYSDLYYDWCNRVVEGVLEIHPDKHFGLLAYVNVAAPPTRVDVHPRLIPFMTYDRMKWIHPEIRADGERMTRAWQEKSPTVGWYDYIYGRPYMLPRVWFRHMADYYRFGHAHGVQAMYAEAYPNWGEGPKLYVTLKLQWDPFQDVDELLDDWCVRCVGEAAAQHLARYYAHWEDFWTRRILDSQWFRLPGQYLPHRGDPTYLLDVTEAELAECRQLLEQARDLTETAAQRARAELLLDAFSFYESSALVYQAGRAPLGAIASEQEALEALERAARALDMARTREHLTAEVFPDHPVLRNITEALLFEHDRGLMDGLWHVYEWAAREEGAVLERIRELARQRRDTELGEALAAVMLVHDEPERMVETIRNGTFEDVEAGPEAAPRGPDWSTDQTPPHWGKWIRPGTTARMEWTEEDAHVGPRSVKVTGATAASFLQTVQVEPGETFLASAFMRAQVAPRGQTRLIIQWQDAEGAWTRAPAVVAHLPPGETDGWVRRAVFFRVPEGAFRAVVGLSVHGQRPGDYAFFDSVSVKRIMLD